VSLDSRDLSAAQTLLIKNSKRKEQKNKLQFFFFKTTRRLTTATWLSLPAVTKGLFLKKKKEKEKGNRLF